MAHLACSAGNNAHDGSEAPAAQRAAALLAPQHDCALDAQPTVPTLQEDGVCGPLYAHEAGSAVFGWIGIHLMAAQEIGSVLGWKHFLV